MNWTTKDSGARQEFSTGSVRDTSDGKPRYDLVSLKGLTRLADLMARGANKYGERNWEKGQPVSRFYQSAFRHLMQWAMGDTSEDHLAAVAFNVFGIIEIQEQVADGLLPKELDDTMITTTRRTRTIRKRILDVLIDQYDASLSQVGVSKALNGDQLYATVLLDLNVDRGSVMSALLDLTDAGSVTLGDEGYYWS